MAKCEKCDKPVSRFSSERFRGKIYCLNCIKKIKEDERKKGEEERHTKDKKNAILKEYDYDARKFLIHLVNTWKPRSCKREPDYTKSLKQFLDKELSPVDIYVGIESGLEHSRLDLVVSKKKPSTGVYRDFAIELKYNLQDSSKFDRLKGQIHTYVSVKFKHIIILLIGKTKAELETELNNYNKEILNHYGSPLRYSNLSLDTIDVIKKK